MRINYYQFPEDTPDEVLKEEGCNTTDSRFLYEGEWRDGVELLHELIDGGVDVDDVLDVMYAMPHTFEYDTTLRGISVTTAKRLLRAYGGEAWTYHCERDGGVFETTPIELKGNNSRFKYNHHL